MRGLLEKIGVSGKTPADKSGVTIEESKPTLPTQKPMSLSELKKNDEIKVATMPVKEASEEKKASLKDVLARISMANKPVAPKEEIKPEPVVIKEEAPKPKEEVKPEPVVIKEEIKPEIKEEPKKEEVKVENPVVSQKEPPSSLNQPEENNSWQKPKAKKEVPEDVLRKVLE